MNSSSEPLVSILIPSYKPSWFRQAIYSALAQTHLNREILVYDNCPTEAIADICRPLPEVRYWRNPRTRLNNLVDIVEASKGDYIKCLFDDDILDPFCVADLVAACRKLGTPFAFSSSWVIDENSCRRRHRRLQVKDDVVRLPGRKMARGMISALSNFVGEFSTVLFDGPTLRSMSREFDACGDQTTAGLVDVNVFLKFLLREDVAYIGRPLSYFRENGESNSNPDRNPEYLPVITDWKVFVDYGRQVGILDDEVFAGARNRYNDLARLFGGRIPSMKAQLDASMFPQTN